MKHTVFSALAAAFFCISAAFTMFSGSSPVNSDEHTAQIALVPLPTSVQLLAAALLLLVALSIKTRLRFDPSLMAS